MNELTVPSLVTIQKIVRSIDKATDLSQALDILVSRIHETLCVDVCSVYLSDINTDTNVLMATRGLNPESIGRINIPFDEGLVGLVTETSEPVNVSNAPSHPRYKYIPDSGEEPYKSFLGVPVSHYGENLAVLVVQQTSSRQFDDQDIAFLTTLAAMIGGNIAFAKIRGQIDDIFTQKIHVSGLFTGMAGAPGICIGTGVISFDRNELSNIPDRAITDFASEEKKFRQAIAQVIEESAIVGKQLGANIPEADRMLFDAYAMIAGSEDLINETIDRIKQGNWAAGALRDTIESYAANFETLDDPYIRERAVDIRNIGRRILNVLLSEVKEEGEFPDNTILIGESLSPLELARVPLEKLAGIISGHGSAYSHIAILAHALNIPAVIGFPTRLPWERFEGKTLIVDGYQGHIIAGPGQTEFDKYQQYIYEEKIIADKLALIRDEPAITPDGIRILLYTNTGLMMGHTRSLEVGTEGIGLYRTELPFMNRDSFPSEEEQYQIYRDAIETYSPKPVTLRTLDVGGDKLLPYFNIKEPNPFLGWRGIRLVLDHPEIFLTQVRAMLRASYGYHNLRILLPMISNLGELDRALSLIHQAYKQVNEDDDSIVFPQIGVMIEVPSAVYQIDSITRRVDFLSVGTNDLIQYLLAVDRNNERVSRLFDPLHPPVLEALWQISESAKKYGKPLSVCGEAAGEPTLAILLIALQTHSLSLSAGDLPRIKWVIRTISFARAATLWQQVRQLEYAKQIRELMHEELNNQGLGGLIRAGN
jgi:phosphotransferase system enzyme I (PtsP)